MCASTVRMAWAGSRANTGIRDGPKAWYLTWYMVDRRPSGHNSDVWPPTSAGLAGADPITCGVPGSSTVNPSPVNFAHSPGTPPAAPRGGFGPLPAFASGPGPPAGANE